MTKGKSSSWHSFTLVFWARGSWGLILLLETDERKIFNNSAFSTSFSFVQFWWQFLEQLICFVRVRWLLSLVAFWLYLFVKWEAQDLLLTQLRKIKAHISQLIAHCRTFLVNILASSKALCGASRILSAWFNNFLGLSSSLDGERRHFLVCWAGLELSAMSHISIKALSPQGSCCAVCLLLESLRKHSDAGLWRVSHHWIMVLLCWWVY